MIAITIIIIKKQRARERKNKQPVILTDHYTALFGSHDRRLWRSPWKLHPHNPFCCCWSSAEHLPLSDLLLLPVSRDPRSARHNTQRIGWLVRQFNADLSLELRYA